MKNQPSCRVCGCHDHNACIGKRGPCYRVEKDLCSYCAEARDIEADGFITVHPVINPYGSGPEPVELRKKGAS